MTGTATSRRCQAGGPASASARPIAPPDSRPARPSRSPPTAPARRRASRPCPAAQQAVRDAACRRQPRDDPGQQRDEAQHERPSRGTRPGSGSAASSGKPGTWPSCEPVRSTRRVGADREAGADQRRRRSTARASARPAGTAGRAQPTAGVERGPQVAGPLEVEHEHDERAATVAPPSRPMTPAAAPSATGVQRWREAEPRDRPSAGRHPRRPEPDDDERAERGTDDGGAVGVGAWSPPSRSRRSRRRRRRHRRRRRRARRRGRRAQSGQREHERRSRASVAPIGTRSIVVVAGRRGGTDRDEPGPHRRADQRRRAAGDVGRRRRRRPRAGRQGRQADRGEDRRPPLIGSTGSGTLTIQPVKWRGS